MQELSDIKTYAKKYSVPICKDDSSDFICDYIREHNCKNVLEIGTAIGFSTIKFAKAAPDVHVTTIEIDIDRHNQALQNISDNGLSDKITAIWGDATQYDIPGKFDVIFIDASKAQYVRFFERYKDNLSEDGVIISDNLAFHGMVEDLSLTQNDSTIRLVKKIRKYINFLKQNTEFQTTFYDFGDGISVSKKIK